MVVVAGNLHRGTQHGIDSTVFLLSIRKKPLSNCIHLICSSKERYDDEVRNAHKTNAHKHHHTEKRGLLLTVYHSGS